MIVKVYDKVYECEKAVKGKDFVELFDKDNNIVANFSGISDFSGYEIVEGSWNLPEKTDKEKISELEIQNADLAEALLQLQYEKETEKLGGNL